LLHGLAEAANAMHLGLDSIKYRTPPASCRTSSVEAVTLIE
jgi:hypothetical protein